MLFLSFPFFLIWIGIKVNMPDYYFFVLAGVVLLDAVMEFILSERKKNMVAREVELSDDSVNKIMDVLKDEGVDIDDEGDGD